MISRTAPRLCLLTAILAIAAIAPLNAQSFSVTDGTTPAVLAPGSPASSYALSNFEQYSPFSGKLNLAIPLHHIGGRGSAGYDMTLRIYQDWIVKKWPSANPSYAFYSNPDLGQWALWTPGYGPGTLFGRESNQVGIPCQNNPSAPQYSLSRLTFTAPDGSETELRDVATDGKPYSIPNWCNSNQSGDAGRSVFFESHDGSHLEFVSDAPIIDFPVYGGGVDPAFETNGYLYFSDGTVYRIDNSNVSWIKDRNGNKISFVYNPQTNQVTSITDQIGRTTSITYSTTGCAGSPSGYCDQIAYSGYGGVAKKLEIGIDGLGSPGILRGDFSLQTFGGLFPETAPYGTNSNAQFNWAVRSYIRYPDESEMKFAYNSYGEVARVILPTGGAIEYDITGFGGPGTDGFMGNATDSGPVAIARVLKTRREYAAGGAQTVTTSYDYSYSFNQGANSETTTETIKDSQGAIVSQTAHNFIGNPYDALDYDGIAYNDWQEGKEQWTQFGSPLLKTINYTWQQARTAPWCNVSSGSPYSCSRPTGGGTPEEDPRQTEIKTTLNDTQQVSDVILDYDQFNNVTDRKEYDFGNGAPGPLLRDALTDYVTDPAYDDIPVRLLRLPSQDKVYDGQFQSCPAYLLSLR